MQGIDKMQPVVVQQGHVIQVKGGAVHHNSLIGKEYGSKVSQPVNDKHTQTQAHTCTHFSTRSRHPMVKAG